MIEVLATTIFALTSLLPAANSGEFASWRAPAEVEIRDATDYGRPVKQVASAKAGEAPRLALITAPGEWGDQVFEVVARAGKGGWAGLRFRNRYDAYITDRGDLVVRRDYQVIHQARLTLASEAYHRLKLIAVGPMLTVEINGKRQVTLRDETQLRGNSGVLVHGADAWIDQVRLTDVLPAGDVVTATVTRPQDALVFEPDQAIAMEVLCVNPSATPRRGMLRATIAPAVREEPQAWHVEGLGDLPAQSRLIVEDGQAMLRLGGADALAMSQLGHRYVAQREAWRTLYMKVQVRRSNHGGAGIHFHHDDKVVYELFFDMDQRLTLRRIDPGWKPVVVQSTGPDFPAEQFHALELYRDGANYAVLVDGKVQMSGEDGASIAGAVGLLARQTQADYRELTISNVLPANDAVKFTAAAPREPVTYTADWAAAWAGREARPWGTAESAVEIGTESRVPLALPALPAGLYDLTIAIAFDDGSTHRRLMPLLVATHTASATRDADRMELIGYGKYGYDDAISDNTYLHAVCIALREQGLTGIIHPFKSREQLDIMQQYGMSAVLREDMAAWMDHPAVVAMLIGDEPTAENAADYAQRYVNLSKNGSKAAMLTCMVGEAMSTGQAADPIVVWDALKPAERMLRMYPMRKEKFDLLQLAPGKGSLLTALERSRDYAATPWWFVVQSFGAPPTPQRPGPFWRDPNEAELNAMTHLAASHGAKGLFFYTFQSEGSFTCLVQARTLRPTGPKSAAMARIAGEIQQAHRILRGAVAGEFPVKCEPATVNVQRYAAAGKKYVWLVNLDTTRGVIARVEAGGRTMEVGLEGGGGIVCEVGE